MRRSTFLLLFFFLLLSGFVSAQIVINKAVYGVLDDADRTRDVARRVRRLVNGGEFTFPVVRLAEGDDPAPRVRKNVAIDYTSANETFSISESDGGEIVIRNSSNATLEAIRAGSGEDFDPESLLQLWIWDAVDPQATEKVFSIAFEVPAGKEIESALFRITADDAYEVAINGKVVGSDTDWKTDESLAVAEQIRDGKNVIAVKANNDSGPGGLIAGLEIVFKDGTRLRQLTGSLWSVRNGPVDDWQSAKAAPSEGRKAIEVGTEFSPVWGLVTP